MKTNKFHDRKRTVLVLPRKKRNKKLRLNRRSTFANLCMYFDILIIHSITSVEKEKRMEIVVRSCCVFFLFFKKEKGHTKSKEIKNNK